MVGGALRRVDRRVWVQYDVISVVVNHFLAHLVRVLAIQFLL